MHSSYKSNLIRKFYDILTDASRHILPEPEPTNQETLETKTAWTA
jgi:hypothetical protein